MILLRVTGYGQTGPYKDRPGFARVAHAVGGLAYLSGMPKGVPVATVAIGEAGAANAGLLAAAMLATTDEGLADRLDAWRKEQSNAVAETVED